MTPSIKVLESASDLRDWRAKQTGRVAFVPTMGALHAGHARLLNEARRKSDQLVLSIFVNPMQFGPNEDFAKYPRTLESDLKIAVQEGVDAVFLPQNQTLYPENFTTAVEETKLTQNLCGKFRPGHFRGVTTVVLKLLNLVQPHEAFFGLKDAQQFFVLERMVRDLDVPVKITGVPTVREEDGLALSSRNAYLSKEERAAAPALYRSLLGTVERLRSEQPSNALDLSSILEDARMNLEQLGFVPQYFDLVELPGFDLARSFRPDSRYLLATASFLGKTRLIDNIILDSSS